MSVCFNIDVEGGKAETYTLHRVPASLPLRGVRVQTGGRSGERSEVRQGLRLPNQQIGDSDVSAKAI